MWPAVAWVPAVLWAAVVFYLSSLPDVPGTGWLDRVPAGDKVGHLALYTVLGLALALGRRRGHPVPHVLVLLAGILYAASDEWHQSLVPGRDPSLADWLADLAGVAAGYWTGWVLTARGRAGTETR